MLEAWTWIQRLYISEEGKGGSGRFLIHGTST